MNERVLNWLLFGCNCITTFVLLIINIFLLKSLIIGSCIKKNLHISLAMGYTIDIGAFTVLAVCLSIGLFCNMVNNTSCKDWTSFIAFNSRNVAYSLMILVFTMRIYYSFRNNPMTRIPKYVFGLLCTSSIVIFIIYIWVFMRWDYFMSISPWLVPVCLIMCGVIYACVSIILVILFTEQIKMVLVDKSNPDREKCIDRQFLYIITKQTLLVSLAVSTSVVAISFESLYYTSTLSHKLWPNVLDCIYTLDAMVSSSCLYFMFNFHDSTYRKLCTKCHILCEKIQLMQIEKNLSSELELMHIPSASSISNEDTKLTI